jgi:hypothetical protein
MSELVRVPVGEGFEVLIISTSRNIMHTGRLKILGRERNRLSDIIYHH